MTVPRNEAAKDRADQEKLEQYISKGYKIFIDTCSLMHPSADKFWTHIVPLLHQYNTKIIIPLKCIASSVRHRKEIQKGMGNTAFPVKIISLVIAHKWHKYFGRHIGTDGVEPLAPLIGRLTIIHQIPHIYEHINIRVGNKGP